MPKPTCFVAPHAEVAERVVGLLRERDALVTRLALLPIEDVYARFAHMGALLSDPAQEPDDPIGRTCWALWAAVRRAVEGADA